MAWFFYLVVLHGDIVSFAEVFPVLAREGGVQVLKDPVDLLHNFTPFLSQILMCNRVRIKKSMLLIFYFYFGLKGDDVRCTLYNLLLKH